MLKKEALTHERIKSDIKDVIKYGHNYTKSEHTTGKLLSIPLSILFIVLLYLWIESLVVIFVAAFLFLVVYPPILIGVTRYRMNKVRESGYEVKEGVVYSISDETYTERRGKYNYVTVTNYYITFEGDMTWHIPENLYCWSEELNMSPSYLYENTHRGDVFHLVLKKGTKDILMAYNTKNFQYSSSK